MFLVLFLFYFTGYVLIKEITLEFTTFDMTLKKISIVFPIIMNHMDTVVGRCPMLKIFILISV